MDNLILWINECSCVCGNRWTHSYPTFSRGGTPGPIEEAKGTITHIIPSRRQFNHCHRCVSLGLGIGWQASPVASPVQSTLARLLAQAKNPGEPS
jgi:hypothetical protein